MTTPVTSIGQISIRVHDIDRAVAFYRDALDSTSCSTPDRWHSSRAAMCV